MSIPRSSGMTFRSLTLTPSITVSLLHREEGRAWSDDLDLGLVAAHHPGGGGHAFGLADHRVAAHEAVGQPAADVLDARARQQDRVLDLAADDRAAVVDGAVRADVRVADLAVHADHGGTADNGVDERGALAHPD